MRQPRKSRLFSRAAKATAARERLPGNDQEDKDAPEKDRHCRRAMEKEMRKRKRKMR